MKLKLKRQSLLFILLLTSLNFFAYPAINYDWQQPARNVSPIGIALGGINQVYAEDFAVAYENPALLALRNGSYFSTTFRSNRMDNEAISNVLNPTYLLSDKQFTYYTFSLPKFALSYQPIYNITETFENSFISDYHDLYLNAFTLSLAAQDDDYTKLTLGFNLKFIEGRQIYQRHRKEIGYLVLEDFVDGTVVGYSSDIGMTYRQNSILVGLTLKDIVSQLYWNDRSNDHLRQRYSLGMGFFNENSTFQLATQGRFNKQEEQTYHVGYGYSLNYGSSMNQSLAFKAGMYSDKFEEMDSINYTFGLGYSLSMFRIDVSLVSAGFTMDNTDYLFSVTVGK